MAVSRITTPAIADEAITQAKIAASVDLGGAIKIANVQVANSSWNLLDDTAVDTDGGYVLVNGTNFASGCNVLVGNVAATSVTFVSATQLRVQVPATAAGSYIMYVSNPDGATGIRLNAITFSADPQWVTDSTLASQVVDSAISVQLSATDATSYSLQAGSSLPANTTLASNGLFSGTITGINEDTVYNFTVVATDAENQDSPRAFSVTVSIGDTYFKETVLLLNSEANTFIRDASNNSFNITPSGDVRPSAFSPYNTGWSNYLNGGSDRLSNDSASVMDVGTGNFTIEMWVFLTSTANQMFFEGSGNAGLQVVIESGVLFGGLSGIGAPVTYTLPSGFTNTWHHIVYVREGTGSNQVSLYVDGIRRSQGTLSNSISTTGFQISRTTSYLFYGYISNLRVVKNSAVYTGATITVPTEPLTAISGTSLLTCQSNRFIDNSTNAFTITRSGNAVIRTFGPFTETDTTTGSAYFDGSGDRLDTPTSGQFNPPGDFTIGFWFYPNSALSINQNIIGNLTGDLSTDWLIQMVSGTLSVYTNGTTARITSSSAIIPFQWNYINVTRSTGVITARVNGTSIGTYSQAGSFGSASKKIEISNATNNVNGYLSDLIFIDGTAVTSVPSSQRTANSQTQILTLQNRIGYNNHQFVDSAGVAHIITRNGNASQGSFSPYVPTGWSGYFDGTGDSVSFTPTSVLNPGTGDFTLELWVYHLTSSTFQGYYYGGATGALNFRRTDGNFIELSHDGVQSVLVTGTSIPANQWNHVALTRSSGTVRIFLNGTNIGSASYSGNFSSSGGTGTIGSITTSVYNLNGYISNFRLIVGNALYTSNFTPPTSLLPPIANTQLLMLRSGSFVDESANRFAITRSGDVRVVPFSPFKSHTITANSHSVYFNGTGAGDYFSVASSNALAFGTGDFAIEGWYYPLAYSSNTSSIMSTTSLDSSTNNAININVTANGSMILGGSYATANNLVPLNTWTHFVVSRVSSTIKIFLNGVERSSAANSTNFVSTGCLIGARLAAGTYYPTAQAYISNIKVVTGFGVTSVTVPTTPLTANSSTVLLTCQSNTIIDNSNNAFSFTAAGTRGPLASKFNPFGEAVTQVVEYSPNTHGGSVYLDGNDYLEYSNNSTINDMRIGTSNWTVEGWIYPTSTGSTQYFYWHYGTTTDVLALRYNGSTGAVIGSLRATNLAEQTLTSSVTHTINQWIHVAMARANTTTVRLFTNGILSNTLTITATSSINDTALQSFTLGCSTNPVQNFFTGHMSDWRYTKGRCLYTTSFIPPLQSYQSIQGTHVLQKFTAGTIIDQSGRAIFEAIGNASTSSAIKKYGTGAMYFDGTDDRITTFASPNYAFGAGDFTVEAWVYTTTLAGEKGFLQTSDTAGGLKAAYTSGITISLVGINDPRYWYVNVAGTGVQSNTSPIINTWYHVAVTRASGSVRLFVNGTLVGGPTSITTSVAGQNLVIGGYYSTNYLWNGYVDDLRITKGVARYTSNFTAPSALQTK